MVDQERLSERNKKMMTYEAIQATLYKYGSKINAPIDILRIYNSPQPDGTPYIQIKNDKYLYILEERGHEFERRVTDNIDQLLYWLMSTVVFSMASRYELNHRINNQDFRKVLFAKELELMKILNKNWYEMKRGEIEKILKNSPYM